jgi:HPt (histidine-containing phosphotransfer) domain-containing protein
MDMDTKVLDENIVAQFSSQQINTYFSLYLKNATAIIDNLQADLESNNIEAIRQRAHKLKGSSMVVGAMAMKNIAQELEEAAKEKRDIEPAKLQELKNSFKNLTDILQQRYNLTFQRG